EDGIRPFHVTGVQTCALPIYRLKAAAAPSIASRLEDVHVDIGYIVDQYFQLSLMHEIVVVEGVGGLMVPLNNNDLVTDLVLQLRSEERRVGRGGSVAWAPVVE